MKYSPCAMRSRGYGMTMHSRTGRRQVERTAAFVDQAAAVDTAQLHCLIPADLHQRIRVLAAQERTNITTLVIAALESYLETRP